jgi:hypothetical protein
LSALKEYAYDERILHIALMLCEKAGQRTVLYYNLSNEFIGEEIAKALLLGLSKAIAVRYPNIVTLLKEAKVYPDTKRQRHYQQLLDTILSNSKSQETYKIFKKSKPYLNANLFVKGSQSQVAFARRVVEELGCVVRTQRIRSFELREMQVERYWNQESIWHVHYSAEERAIVAPLAKPVTLEYLL